MSIERAEPPQHVGWNTEAYSATDIREDESVRYAALSHPTRNGAPDSIRTCDLCFGGQRSIQLSYGHPAELRRLWAR